MAYRKTPRTNYFAYIMGLNALITVCSTIGLFGLLESNFLMISIGAIGVMAFFVALYVVFKIAVHREAERDDVLIQNIKQKYIFTSAKLIETSVEDRVAYGAKVVVSDNVSENTFFVRTKPATNEPFLFEVINGEKILIDSRHLRDAIPA